MPARDKKEIADALAALAGGQNVEPSDAQAAAPSPPASSKSPAGKQPAPSKAGINLPPAGKPISRSPQKAPPPKSKPVVREPAPMPRPQPSPPPLATPPDDDPLSSALSSVAMYDDDSVIIPAPDPSVFAARETPAQYAARRALHVKRTLIPILLTCGVLLPLTGAMKWLGGPGSPFADWDLWIPIAMCGLGGVLLVLAALNMLQVRDQLIFLKRHTARAGGRSVR